MNKQKRKKENGKSIYSLHFKNMLRTYIHIFTTIYSFLPPPSLHFSSLLALARSFTSRLLWCSFLWRRSSGIWPAHCHSSHSSTERPEGSVDGQKELCLNRLWPVAFVMWLWHILQVRVFLGGFSTPFFRVHRHLLVLGTLSFIQSSRVTPSDVASE